ncbi:MAG: DUF6788 family protein [bacterium]
MKRCEEIEKRRSEILKEMEGIRSMRRGRVDEQYLKVPHKGKKEPVFRGPYYVFSRHEKGEGTKSYRLTTQEDVDNARRDVAAHKRFQELCREYEELTEELGRLERESDERSPEKKTRKSGSRRTRK